MRRTISLLGILLTLHICKGQQRELDSLTKILQTYVHEDTVKLNLLLDITFDYAAIDPEKGLETADKAIALSLKLANRYKLASAYNYKGVNYDARGDNELALAWYTKCLDIRRQMRDTLNMARSFHNIGIVYFNLSDYQKSLEYHQSSLDIFNRYQHTKASASALNSIGVVYLSLADYPKALEYYFRALSLFEKFNDTHNTGNACTNIGLVYNHSSDYQHALDYHFKALKIFEQEGNKQSVYRTLGNIGNSYDGAGDPQKAIEYYRKALDIAESIGARQGIANNFSNLGVVYNKLGDYHLAIQYLQQSVDLYEKLGDKNNLSSSLIQMGTAYRKAPASVLEKHGSGPENRYSKSLEFLNRAQALAGESGAVDVQSSALEEISQTYAAQKDFKRSLDAYMQHIILRDSVMNNEKKQEITKMDLQYEFDKKESLLKAEHDKKQALAMAEIKRQHTVRNYATAGGIILLAAALIIFFSYKRRRDAEEKKKEAEFRAQSAETEMKALRLQMNPHFIFNSLNSISDYILNHDISTADYYLTKFAKVMRITLENSEHREIPLSEDLEALELYMQLESLRLNNTFTYEIRVDDEIDPANTLVPPMLLQPFVENSIWHGLANKQGKGRIIIGISKAGEMLVCTVEDNGEGRNGKPKPGVNGAKKKSMGVNITEARIDIINKNKRSKAGIVLSDLPQGLKVEVKLPLELSF